MTRYDIATLSVRLGAAGKLFAGIDAWSSAREARGKLFGCWLSETGELSEISLLRGFADDADMQAERWRTLATINPFHCGDQILEMRFDSYVPFPWVPAVAPGRYGEIYEIRTYRLKHGGVPATMAAWEGAIAARQAFSPLILAMYAVDGAPRFTHIWAYKSISQRAKVRQEIVAKGVWPPPGGPDWLTGEMTTIIGVPVAISLLV